MARRLDRLNATPPDHTPMRLIAMIALLAAAGPLLAADAEPDLRAALTAADGKERYRLALAALRGADNPARLAGHPDRRVAEAAIDAARERLADSADQPTPAAEQLAESLLVFAGAKSSEPGLAMRAVHAVAESRNPFEGRISGAVARLALDPACGIRTDAIAALAELGDGAQAATLARLAGDADPAVAEAAREGLVGIQGKGVTDTFVRGITDAGLDAASRVALLQAATKRGMAPAAPAAAKALADPALRLEAQKALLKLARKEHLPALREAREQAKDAAATRAALDRLIARLEKE